MRRTESLSSSLAFMAATKSFSICSTIAMVIHPLQILAEL